MITKFNAGIKKFSDLEAQKNSFSLIGSIPEAVKTMSKWYTEYVQTTYAQAKFYKCPILKNSCFPKMTFGWVRSDCSGFVSACLALYGIYVYNPFLKLKDSGNKEINRSHTFYVHTSSNINADGNRLGHVKDGISSSITGRYGRVFTFNAGVKMNGNVCVPPTAKSFKGEGSTELRTLEILKSCGFIIRPTNSSEMSTWKPWDIIIGNSHIEIYYGNEKNTYYSVGWGGDHARTACPPVDLSKKPTEDTGSSKHPLIFPNPFTFTHLLRYTNYKGYKDDGTFKAGSINSNDSSGRKPKINTRK